MVQFQDVLHRICAGKGTGTAIMELKLTHELSSVYQGLLFLVLFDLMKAYDNLYQWRLLQTLVGYGAGTKLRSLSAEFWARQDVVTQQNGFRGTHL